MMGGRAMEGVADAVDVVQRALLPAVEAYCSLKGWHDGKDQASRCLCLQDRLLTVPEWAQGASFFQ